MSKEKYGFVYIWYDKKHKRYYVGCHWGTEDDGYICSSSWMMKGYKRRPADFKRRILKSNITSKVDLYLEEGRWLSMIDKSEIKPINETPRYYNLKISTDNLWHQYDEKVKTIGEKISAAKKGKSTGPCSTETRDKISKSNTGKKRTEEMNLANSERSKGRISPNKGKKMSEDQKQKLREINLGKKASDATRKKLSDRLKGRIVSQETRDKIAAANKGGIGRTGQTLSEEHKKKISEAAKRRYTLAK
jgi:hypothetical protein